MPPPKRSFEWSTVLEVGLVILLLVLGIVWLLSNTLHLTQQSTSKVLTEPFQNYGSASGDSHGIGNGNSNSNTNGKIGAGVFRYDPNAPDPILSVSDEELQTYTSEFRNTPKSIYDESYAHLYRVLIDDPRDKITTFEVNDLIDRTQLREFGSKAVVMDIGCGTGAHLEKLADVLPSATLYGLDQSRAMLDVAETRMVRHNNRVRLMEGNFNRMHSVYEGMCTHLTCFYFSFYYATSSKRFFKHAHHWLQPKGYLVLHLVDPDNFDPVPEVANPIRGISIQRYYAERKTDAKVIINSPDNPQDKTLYTCDFEHDPDNHTAVLTEAIIHPTERFVRRHRTELRMPHHEAVIQTARRTGFRLRHVTSLLAMGDEYEYLCYLQKEDA